MDVRKVLEDLPIAQAAFGAALAGIGPGLGPKVTATLVAAAARGAAQGCGSCEPSGLGTSDGLGFFCEQVEEVLTAVGGSMGLEGRATVTQAKDALRRTGADGAKAASCLGKLT